MLSGRPSFFPSIRLPASLRSKPVTLLAASLVCGLGIAACGVTLVRAADDTGLLDFIRSPFLDQAARLVRLDREPNDGDRWFARRRPQQRAARKRTEPIARYAVVKRTSNIRKKKSAVVQTAAVRATPWGGGAGRTMCVRMCDGYVFPVGNLRGRADLPTHQTACTSACPGADTQLFTLGAGLGLEDPGAARSVKDGTSYRALRTALLFRKDRVKDCSCTGPDNIATRLPILSDPTLRIGDVVIGRTGDALAFDGTGPTPHRPRDFASYRTSPALGRLAKAQVDKAVGTSQREALAQSFARSQRQRQAALEARPIRQASLAGGTFREVAAPAGSGTGVRVYQMTAAGVSDASGVRVITIR